MPPKENKEVKARLEELDRITKMLVKRDFELMRERERREMELSELIKAKEQLEDQNIELNKMNHLMIGRENRMVELKEEVNTLREENERLRKLK
ncbi:MAG: hypothetical protein Q8P70_01885 [bacterium]|nr:hypothetical protein [bacterium]